MKHNCNQYTMELLYNELIIIKSSSHFNLQPWKWEIVKQWTGGERQDLCPSRWASNGSQAKRDFFSCVQHLRCLFAQLFPRLEQKRECQVPEWILWTKKPAPAKEAPNQTTQSETYFKYHLGGEYFCLLKQFFVTLESVRTSMTPLAASAALGLPLYSGTSR